MIGTTFFAVALCSLPVFWVALKLISKPLGNYFVRKFTVLLNVKDLGRKRPDENRVKGTAVICGGSIAGLWAARIAADHFEDVLVVEPESWTLSEEGKKILFDAEGTKIEDTARVRSRCMQYRASHNFQPLQLDCLRAFFPNVDKEIQSAGGHICPPDTNSFSFGRRVLKLPKSSPASVFFLTRDAFERMLRRLVLGSSNRIRTFAGMVVNVCTAPNDSSTLSSVIVRTSDGEELDIPASLVVNCMGMSRTGLKWLRRLAPHIPSNDWDTLKEEYDANARFVTMAISVPPHVRSSLPIPNGYDADVWLVYVLLPRPGVDKNFFVLNRVEGHRLFLYITTSSTEVSVPTRLEDVPEWLQENLSEGNRVHGWILDILRILIDAKSEVSVTIGRNPRCSWIHYERAPYMPSNFIAIGDSVMNLNPVFGQGCSKATIGAVTLDTLLRQFDGPTLPKDFGRLFFSAHCDKIIDMWNGTKPVDYLLDTTTPSQGEKLSDLQFAGKIQSLALELAGWDKEVDETLFKTSYLMAPGAAFLQPRILLKLLVFAIRKRVAKL